MSQDTIIHFIDKRNRVACGRGSADSATTDVHQVTCQKCARSIAYKKAMNTNKLPTEQELKAIANYA